jgi:hypothetical protein
VAEPTEISSELRLVSSAEPSLAPSATPPLLPSTALYSPPRSARLALDPENNEMYSAAIEGIPKVVELIAAAPEAKRQLALAAAKQSYLQTARALGYEESDAQHWASVVISQLEIASRARQRESKIITRNISSSQLTAIHQTFGPRLFKRTSVVTLWIFGLFTCSTIGGVIAVQIYTGDDARFWGAIAGMVAFTGARLWPAQKQ